MDERFLLAEGLSRAFLDMTGLGSPVVDVVAHSAHLGVKLVPARQAAVMGGNVSTHNGLPEPRQRIRTAHELGHILAERAGEDPRDETLAWATGAGLLMPAREFRRDLAERCWDLDGLPGLYGVSWEVLVRRLCHVAGAVVSIWDNGRLSRRWRSPWLQSYGFSGQRVPDWEMELADECRRDAWHVFEEDGVAAYYVPSPGWQRVIVVAEVEAWEERSRLA